MLLVKFYAKRKLSACPRKCAHTHTHTQECTYMYVFVHVYVCVACQLQSTWTCWGCCRRGLFHQRPRPRARLTPPSRVCPPHRCLRVFPSRVFAFCLLFMTLPGCLVAIVVVVAVAISVVVAASAVAVAISHLMFMFRVNVAFHLLALPLCAILFLSSLPLAFVLVPRFLPPCFHTPWGLGNSNPMVTQLSCSNRARILGLSFPQNKVQQPLHTLR